MDNTIPSWLLPCTCHQPRCICPIRLKLDILCILGAPQWPNHPLPWAQTLKCKYAIFSTVMTYSPVEATTINHMTYATLQPLPTQLGWTILPLNIITAGIRGTIHITPSVPKWLFVFSTLARLRPADHWPSSCKYNSTNRRHQYSKMPPEVAVSKDFLMMKVWHKYIWLWASNF